MFVKWILGNIFITSKLIKKAFSEIQLLFKLSIMFNMSFVSFIHDGKFSASLYSSFSTNIDNDSTAVLQPLVITFTKLFLLWVFTLPYILPDLECSGVIHLTQSLLKVFFECPLSIQSLTLRSNSWLHSLGSTLNELLAIWNYTLSS